MRLDDGTIIGDRYRLLRRLNHHRGASLWEAYDDKAMQEVHLRILDPHLRAEKLVSMRFRREYAIAGRMDHPALIAPVALVEDSVLALV